MNSILKILVDDTCQIYCDYEFKGELSLNSIFKLELRKGTYILEFKKDGCTLKTQEYKMQSNNEEDLIRISIKEESQKYEREKCFENIKNKKVSWFHTGDAWRIVCNDGILNSISNESWIDLPSEYQLFPMERNKKFSTDIDACGLIPFNIGGEISENADGDYAIVSGKWGCLNKIGEIQIAAEQDECVFFKNDNATTIYYYPTDEEVKRGLINKYGKSIIPRNHHFNYPIREEKGYYCISQFDGKRGICDKNGDIIISCKYKEFYIGTDNNIWAQDYQTMKWGMIDYKDNIILPFLYEDVIGDQNDSLTSTKEYLIKTNKKWGSCNLNGIISIAPIYEYVVEYYHEELTGEVIQYGVEYSNEEEEYAFSEPEYKYYYYCVVKRNNKYGVVNTNFKDLPPTKKIKEIIPCIYDYIYLSTGHKLEEKEFIDRILDHFCYRESPFGDFIFVKEKTPNYASINNHNSLKQCAIYNREGNITTEFECNSFNSIYREFNGKYQFFQDKKNIQYNKISSLIAFDGTWDWEDIIEFEGHSYKSIGIMESWNSKCYYDAVIGDKHYIINADDNSKNFGCLISGLICDSIGEFGFGRYSYNYFIVTKIQEYYLLNIYNDENELIFQSEPMKEICSVYKAIVDNNEFLEVFRGFQATEDIEYFICKNDKGEYDICYYNDKDYKMVGFKYKNIKVKPNKSIEVTMSVDEGSPENNMVDYKFLHVEADL